MEQENTVTFERILFDIQLDIYNSVRIYFGDFFIARDFYFKLKNVKIKNLLFDLDWKDYHISMYNYASKNFNHATYDYIKDNNFQLRGIEYGNSDI